MAKPSPNSLGELFPLSDIFAASWGLPWVPLLWVGPQALHPQGLHSNEGFWSVCCYPSVSFCSAPPLPKIELEDRFTPGCTLGAYLEVLEGGKNLTL